MIEIHKMYFCLEKLGKAQTFIRNVIELKTLKTVNYICPKTLKSLKIILQTPCKMIMIFELSKLQQGLSCADLLFERNTTDIHFWEIVIYSMNRKKSFPGKIVICSTNKYIFLENYSICSLKT